MRRKTRSLLISALLVVGLVIPVVALTAGHAATSPAETRRVSQVYLAGTGLLVDCDSLQGGACFPLLGDELQAAIGVVDDLGRQPVSARYEFRDAAGAVLGSGMVCDVTTATVPAGSSLLAVMVPVLDPLGCGDISIATTGKIHVVTKVSDGEFQAFDVEPQECLQPVPHAISVAGLTEPKDHGQRVVLDTYVLLDGVSQERGQQVMEKAAQAYAPLGIDMRFGYQSVTLPEGSGQLMNSHSMNAVGGAVPSGYDIVHTLTSKELNVAGQADCIGGVRYRDRAFSVSTDLEDRPIQYVGPIEGRMINDYAAKIVAHEIGHTMGAHHHYGNCVEAIAVDVQSCTVMLDPSPFPKELVFGTVNGAIVRAHAVRYADD